MDGNGRIGRLWQTVILGQYSPVFEFLPIELLIKARQSEYYKILGECDNKGDSTGFIEFMLQIINESLEELLTNQSVNLTSHDRIVIFKEKIRKSNFNRQDYMRQFKDISTANQIESVNIRLFEIELKLANTTRTLNLDNLQFEDLRKVKDKFERISNIIR